MNIKSKTIRDICSILLSFFYLFFANQADYKVRRLRNSPTLQGLRVSWEKQLNPYVLFLRKMLMKKIKTKKVEKLQDSTVNLYFDGTDLGMVKNIILHIPGGGFIAMPPECHEDYLCQWAHGMPNTAILSVNYKKAPEYPFPHALEECFEIYKQIIETNGKCFGINTSPIIINSLINLKKTITKIDLDRKIKIIVCGDSAGGSLAAGVVNLAIEARIRVPDSLCLIYPSLAIDMACWLTQSQKKYLDPNVARRISKNIEHDYTPSPKTKRTIFDEFGMGDTLSFIGERHVNPTTLTLSSRIAFFNDRILPQETLRALALLYIGHKQDTEVEGNYLISPILTPESILSEYPKTYLLCGDKDPLLDDCVIFGGKIREAKTIVTLALIKGVSHGFLNLMAFLPEGRKSADLIMKWFKESFI